VVVERLRLVNRQLADAEPQLDRLQGECFGVLLEF
jgi:hypothetical protein